MHRDSSVVLMGEDVAEAGTPFKVLLGLVDEFGPERVIDGDYKTRLTAPRREAGRVAGQMPGRNRRGLHVGRSSFVNPARPFGRKGAMEVPTGADGVLAEIRAQAGTEASVGDVIAIIADVSAGGSAGFAAPKEHAAAPFGPDSSDSAGLALSPAATIGNTAIETGASASQAASAAPRDPSATGSHPPAPGLADSPKCSARRRESAGRRVLASPKARRVAQERGINLSDLVRRGIREPIHVRDLDRDPQAGPALSHLVAQVKRSAFDSLLAAADELLDGGMTFGVFAAGAFRRISEIERVVVDCGSPGEAVVSLVDPDRAGLLSLGHDPECGPPSLCVVDLSETRLSAYRPAEAGVPILSIGVAGDDYVLTLTFREFELPVARAANFLDSLAGRIEDPVRQLL